MHKFLLLLKKKWMVACAVDATKTAPFTSLTQTITITFARHVQAHSSPKAAKWSLPGSLPTGGTTHSAIVAFIVCN